MVEQETHNNNDLHEILERNTELLEENNTILLKMRAVQKRQTFWTIVYWVLIIGATYGLIRWMQPLMQQVDSAIAELRATVPNVNKTVEEFPANFQGFFESFQKTGKE